MLWTLINPALLDGNIPFFQFLIRFASSPNSLAQFFLNNSLVPRLGWMAQALGKVNVSKTEKNEFSAQKMVIFSKFPFLAKSSFLKKSWPIAKTNPMHLHDKCNKSQYFSVITTKCGTAAKRRYRKKKLEIPKEGARGDRGLSDQNQMRYNSFLLYA